MHDPNDVPNGISGVRDDASMEMKPLPTNVPHGLINFGGCQIGPAAQCGHN